MLTECENKPIRLIDANEKTKRVAWIDSFRGIAMVLVIYGHIFGYEIILGRFFYLFHVPAFFFLSGYLFDPNKTCSEFLKSRFRTLLWPFLTFGLTTIMIDFCIHLITKQPYDLVWQLRCMFIQMRGENNRIWFLPCLFLSEIIMYCVLNRKAGFALLGVGLLLSWFNALITRIDLPWYPDTAVIGTSLMLIGYKSNELKRYVDKKRCLFIVCGFLICALILYINIRLDIYIDMVNNNYGYPLLFYVGTLSGITSLYCIASFVQNGIILFIGQNTIVFLCMNSICIKISNVIVNMLPINYNYLGFHILTFIGSLVLLSIITMFINCYLPFYLWRK